MIVLSVTVYYVNVRSFADSDKRKPALLAVTAEAVENERNDLETVHFLYLLIYFRYGYKTVTD